MKDCEDLPNEQEDIIEGFKNRLLSEYAAILNSEYEYRISNEAVKESIIANEYTFLKNGEFFPENTQ
jgi:hypothetical protein